MIIFPRRYLVNFIVLVMIAFSCISCDTEEPVKEAQNDVDSYALWKAQPNEKIVFMSRADSPEGELYLLDKSGKITRLTNNNQHENNPAISFDGTKIAFNRGDESNPLSWEIYILDLRTGKEIQLTDNRVLDAHPDWSPDGSRIVFGSFRDAKGNPSGAADIYVMNIDGSNLTQLTNSPWEDNDPEWSPDGSKIVFKSTRHTKQSGREEIYIMNSDGTEPQRLTATTGWESDHDPSWSPDGKNVLFIRFEGSRTWFDIKDFARDWKDLVPWNVHRVDLSGNIEKLTNNLDTGWGIAIYAADGKHILFGKTNWIIDDDDQVIGGIHRLILMNLDGSNQQQLLPDDKHTGTLEYFDW